MAYKTKINQSAIKRIGKALDSGQTSQSRRGLCIVCQQDWMYCPHSRAEVDDLFDTVKLSRSLAALAGTEK